VAGGAAVPSGAIVAGTTTGTTVVSAGTKGDSVVTTAGSCTPIRSSVCKGCPVVISTGCGVVNSSDDDDGGARLLREAEEWFLRLHGANDGGGDGVLSGIQWL